MCVCVCVCVTDDLLELAFAMGPHLRHLSMGRLGLQSDKWSHMDWPWVSLSMYESESMGALLDLPHPKTYKGEGVPRIAIFDGVYVDSDKVSCTHTHTNKHTHTHTHTHTRTLDAHAL